MALNTFQGKLRSYGGAAKEDGVTPGAVVMSAVVACDPVAASATAMRIGTSATSGATFVLPKGAVPISFLSLGGITGGVSPTVDIGTSASPAGFFNEVSNTVGALKGPDGAAVLGLGIAAPVTVTGMVGASAGTGGTFVGVFTYMVYDDGYEGGA